MEIMIVFTIWGKEARLGLHRSRPNVEQFDLSPLTSSILPHICRATNACVFHLQTEVNFSFSILLLIVSNIRVDYTQLAQLAPLQS